MREASFKWASNEVKTCDLDRAWVSAKQNDTLQKIQSGPEFNGWTFAPYAHELWYERDSFHWFFILWYEEGDTLRGAKIMVDGTIRGEVTSNP